MAFTSLLGMFLSDYAIDLGTASTQIYEKGAGVVLNEPSVVAIQQARDGQKRVVAVGAEAKNMLGRTPGSITAVRPLRHGTVSDFKLTGELVRQLMSRVRRRSLVRPRIVVTIPHGISEVEKRAVRESVETAGAREVYLLEEPLAAAIGAGLPVTDASGNLILDIGGGRTEIAIISLGGIVYCRSLTTGGDKMDEAIMNYVRRRHNLLIGERTAEQVKLALGGALYSSRETVVEVRGRDVMHGVPRATVLTEHEVVECLSDCVFQIVDLVRTALEKAPPELSSDISDKGVTLTGGGSMLRGLSQLITRELKLPTLVVEDPLSTVIAGTGVVVDQFDALRDVVIQ